eukprot:2359723-Lingulodinium_polyedra.AAC.1
MRGERRRGLEAGSAVRACDLRPLRCSKLCRGLVGPTGPGPKPGEAVPREARQELLPTLGVATQVGDERVGVEAG